MKEGREATLKVMMKKDIWLTRMNVGMKKKYRMLHLKKGKSLVEKKGLRIRKMQRSAHMRTVRGKGMKLDLKKEMRNGRLYTDLHMKRGRQMANWREEKYKHNEKLVYLQTWVPRQ